MPNCLVGLRGFVMFALESLNAFNVCVVIVFGLFILSFFFSFCKAVSAFVSFALVMHSVVICLLSLNKVSLK